jgi:hypothetical protein
LARPAVFTLKHADDEMFAMSNVRAMPGGWVDPTTLDKGPNERSLCRWCNLEVPNCGVRLERSEHGAARRKAGPSRGSILIQPELSGPAERHVTLVIPNALEQTFHSHAA